MRSIRSSGFAAPDCRLSASRGFTLLELLAVLAVLGALLAVAIPQFDALYTRLRFTFEQDDIERQLLELPQWVSVTGRGGVLATHNPASAAPADPPVRGDLERWQALSLELPDGWSMRARQPLYYHLTGACEGGELIFSLGSFSLRYTLTPPLCRPVRANESE